MKSGRQLCANFWQLFANSLCTCVSVLCLCECLCVCASVFVCLSVCMYQYLFVCKASELVAVKSKADEIISQKTALDDHIATLKVTFYTSHTGRRRITWMKTVLNDLESHNLTLTEAVNMAQNRPLWRLLALCTHSDASQK